MMRSDYTVHFKIFIIIIIIIIIILSNGIKMFWQVYSCTKLLKFMMSLCQSGEWGTSSSRLKLVDSSLSKASALCSPPFTPPYSHPAHTHSHTHLPFMASV